MTVDRREQDGIDVDLLAQVPVHVAANGDQLVERRVKIQVRVAPDLVRIDLDSGPDPFAPAVCKAESIEIHRRFGQVLGVTERIETAVADDEAAGRDAGLIRPVDRPDMPAIACLEILAVQVIEVATPHDLFAGFIAQTAENVGRLLVG